jgi:TatD DNase family protein
MADENVDALNDLIDIGANLTHESFRDDLPEVLDRAAEVGVSQLLVTGSDVENSLAALELARSHPGQLFATAGMHPHMARDWNSQANEAIRDLGASPEIVAIGEAGLDFFRDISPRRDQEKAFEAQLEIAIETDLPIFMHSRDAGERFVDVVKNYRDQLKAGVVHCFTGSREELHACLDLDLHVGITGWICDERRGQQLRELVVDIPSARLMIETDAPYLMPRDLRPKPKTRRNEPMHLAHIARMIALCRGELPTQLAVLATNTTRRFFNLPVHAE